MARMSATSRTRPTKLAIVAPYEFDRAAQKRGARIYGELLGHCVNSDGTDFVLPDAAGQNACIRGALTSARLAPEEIGLVSTHATSTPSGDVIEARVVREVFGDGAKTWVNNTKSFIGHAMGAAGALEMLGNVPAFADRMAHATINLDDQDERCGLRQIVANKPRYMERVEYLLNNSFGMLGINSVLIVKKFPHQHGGVYE